MIPVIRKELLEHVQSLQFMILFLLVAALFSVNSFLFIRKYDEQSAWFNRHTAETSLHPSTVSTALYVRPSSFAFIAEGNETLRPAGYVLSQKGFLDPLPAGAGNFKMPAAPPLDWSFIIKIVFSLYVILLGYDSIAGEKERGTLRQMLSEPLSRTRLLAAKFIAIMITVALPLACGILINLIIIGLFIPTVLTAASIARVLLTLLLSALYLSLFGFLSLFASSVIHQPSLVLLVLLAGWIFAAVVVPGAADILSEELSALPSEYSIAKELGPTIQRQIWAKMNTISEKASHGEITTEAELKHQTDLAFNEGQQSLIAYYESYRNASRQRSETARMLSRLSPTALFQYASEDLAGTGNHRDERFLEEARAYSRIYDNYVLNKSGVLLGRSYWSFGTFIDLHGKSVFISSPRAQEFQGDKSDFPGFVDTPPSVLEGVERALMDCAGLILWTVVLAMLAFGAIRRSDVR